MNASPSTKFYHHSPFPRRAHKWLWVLMGALLLSTLIELGHNHFAHANAREAAHCVICQHSVSLNKILPPEAPAFMPLLGFVAIIVRVLQGYTSTFHLSFRSRAPPTEKFC